ncbi:unnamed protein product [Alopecurus aequalis]
MNCQVCNRPEGPCRNKTRDCTFFISKLPEEFSEALVVPCYVKDKINTLYNGLNVMHVEEDLLTGTEYDFDLQKTAETTSFVGAEWKRFIEDFKMKAGEFILFDMTNTAQSNTILIRPMDGKKINKFRPISEYPGELDEVHQKHTAVVFTKGTKFTMNNKQKWHRVVTARSIGLGPLFVHKLTDTNINKLTMKIPKIIAAALNMERNGDVRLCGISDTTVEGKFNTVADGRVEISRDAWKTFVDNNQLNIGKIVMFMFHLYEEDTASTSRMVVSVDEI